MTAGDRRRPLSPLQLARVQALLREDETAAGAVISRRGAAGMPPLSVGEEQLWFLARLADDASYGMPFELRLRGRLEVAALAGGIAALSARHEALRTAYPAPAGRPVKVAIPALPAMPVIDLRRLPAAARETAADRLARNLGLLPFDLERGPLLRAALLALGADRYRLFLSCHHIVADGASIALLWRELPVLYRDLARRAAATLAAPVLQYGDFAAWQAEWMRGEEAATQRAYWRERLRGVETLALPTDRPSPAATSRGGVLPLSLTAACGEGLRRLGREERATLFMVLLAAFQTLLHRWSGQVDFTIGSPVSGRQRPELAEVFGFFVNMVVLRADLAGDPPLRAAVVRARETALGAFSQADLPFAALVEERQPDRRLGRNPLFRAVLVLQDPAPAALLDAGLAWDLREVLIGTAKFDLEVELRDDPQGLTGRLWYARDLFDTATARRLAGHLQTLLEGMAGAAASRLSELPLLAAPERHQITVEWCGAPHQDAAGRGIHPLFAEQVARTPDAIAVVFGDARLSYRELDRRAGRIARRLVSLGIGAESRVGIFTERSLEMVAATLGVLQAGAAYVPLDVASPGERLAWLLADARLGVLLIQERLAGRLPAPACHRLILEEAAAAPAAAAGPAGEEALPDIWAGPDSAACLMYTSGSTGFPKAVMITHRNVVRLVHGTDFATFGPAEVVLQLAPISFDAATLEIWGALLHGGTLAVCDPGLPSLAELGRTIERERVTTLWLTAGLFHQMVDRQLPSLAGVRQLLAGGDVLSPAHLARAWSALPGCRLINGYGPTENTTFTSCHLVVTPPTGSVPIGRPIVGTWVQVVDAAGRPVPVGAPGELLAGGEGLARGYFHRPDLTAERFVPDPVAAEPGARLYRTGDLVRWRADGALEFLGRFDGQVKIRGFRVETAEVERAMERHPEVAACAVVARRDPPGDLRLVAYLVPAGASAPAAGELRACLARWLPEPMIPAAFVPLAALPITRNGKLDRGALPAPAAAEPERAGAAASAPCGADEELLAAIWGEVLGRQEVGADADFFALGGQSLQLMQVASRVRDAFGVELPLRALFEAPTVKQLAPLLAHRRGSTASLLPAIRRQPRGEAPPLSFAQRRLWFLDQLDPGRATYHVPLVVDLRGALDTAALAAALGEILRRHEALRTVFPARRGEPFQSVLAAAAPAIGRVDLAGLPEHRRHAAAEGLAGGAARQPFDLCRGPVMRLLLLRLAADEHRLVVVCHHIAADGWSLRVLLSELEILYTALLRRAPALLPELPVQYADYARWQQEWLRGEILDRQLDLWRERLTGLPALDLATDRPRPPVRSQRGAVRAGALAGGLPALLRAAARREGATLFIFLLASLQALLHRCTGQEDFAIGTAIAGRRRPEIEPLIGFFANTLVLRGRVAAGLPFRTLLASARDAMLAAHDHQDVPFERLVEELRPDRDLGRTPFFQVMLNVGGGGSALRLPGLATRVRTVPTGTAKFDLGFSLLAAGEQDGEIAVEYATDLFEPATGERLIAHWSRLLAGAATDPAAAVAALPLLTEAERQQLLREWNDTAVPGASPAPLHQLFEARAALAPEAVAVVCRGEVWTYGGLNARANRLARHLRALGVDRGSPVAVRLRRSPEMLLAVFAILKAGGAYVPLDHRFPDARTRWVLEQLPIAWVLTDRHHLARLAGLGARHLRHAVCLGQEESAAPPTTPATPATPASNGWEVWHEEAAAPLAATNLPAQGDVDDPAYILFTSGSTGTPKGVMVSHRPVVALIQDIGRRFALGPADRGLQVTAISFDLSVFDVFGLLGCGASLRIAVEEEIAEPREIARILRQEPITFWNSAPAFLQQAALFFPRTAEPGASLRLVMLAGDWIPVPLPDRVRAAFPGAEVVTLGGPTETVVWTNVNRVRAVDPLWPSIPYGRPLSGVRLHLLDESQNLCPAGVPGEIHVGGGCLAIGYAGDPEATASKFLPDPLGDQPGARLYASGDQARHRPDGVIEFLGRRDTQVKIRGFRIELGEIEAALRAAPGVRETVAIVREDRPGDRQLVSYLCGDPPPAFSPRQFLAERLPDYMVPAAFVWLEALPVTANGKLDRRALPPAVAPAGPDANAAAVPLTPMEELLAGIWAGVLGREGIGPQDQFFDLGGHSLKATQVVSRLYEALCIELPLRAVFETPRLGDLARRLDRELLAGATDRRREPPRPIDRSERIPLSLAQQRLWFLDRLEPGIYNIPVLLGWDGTLDARLLERALAAILARHEALRTAIEVVDGEPVQVIGPPPGCRLPRIDLAALPAGRRAAAAEALATALGRAAFDLAAGSPVRFLLFRLDEREHRLLAVFHHIAADGWSLSIFVRELGELYRAFEAGAADPLPALPLQYADFAAWQREGLRGAWLQRDLAYWRQRLAGLPVLELPTDRPRPARRTFRGASRPFVPPAALGARLQAAARAQGATRFMVLLAALAALLARLSGQEDFAIGTPVANRGQSWTEGLIGYFVNTLALRTSLAGLPSFDELLRRVRDTALGAYAHQELPFEWLVDELAPPRDLSHSPLFQVRFAFQDELLALDLPGRRLRVQGLAVEVAKFDLLLAVGDSLEGYLQYNTDLFDPATAERLIQRYARLLEAALDAPGVPLAELPLLDAAERQLLLVEWNDTAAPGPAAPVHERFASWAARRPEAPALVCEEVRWSYGELAERVDRVAADLRSAGVGAESLVGICLPRSADAVLALLATLTAGGAYVPLDPSHPAERLAELLSASGTSVVITTAELRDRLPAGTAVLGLAGGGAPAAPGIVAASPPAGGAGLDRLAYVLFTSGSTGRPKGVAVGHRQLAGYVDAVLCRLGLPAGAAYATVSTLAADLGNTAVFPALCTGGCLHVLSERRVTDPSLFAEYLRRERIDCLKIVPSHLAALQSGTDPAAALPRLRLVLGGEASTWEMVAGLHAAAPGLGVLNHYGPTEATVGVLTWPAALRVASAASVPLGRPLPHARVYVLDQRLEPLPAGVPGELAIGGDSLARGYHRQPAPTAERFVPDPFAGRPGARLYRTGDRARHLPDGAVEFLGRLDHQVKIRGFRVEPAEIEVALARVAGVREAVVMTRTGADGSPELVAWVAGERLPEPAALREALRGELPLYMIPAVFVPLISLPLTANGKVDRQALPAPERRLAPPAAAPPAAAPGRPPAAALASPLAQQIAAIWREVLGREEVGLHDNFFDLGGHSLLLIRVRGRLRRELGHQVTVLDLFGHPTISALAAHLGGAPQEASAPAGPPPSPQPPPAPETANGRLGVAVIGLAGRFPGAGGVRQLWENLCRGVESITFSGEPRDIAPGQRHVPARGTLADLDLFDAAFFGIRPREAELLDPQHRLFLECAWEALESAGYDPGRTPGAIGVWSGVGKAWYYLNQIHGGPDAEHHDAHFGNDKDFLPTRVSYKLGLRGPSMSVQTSCSSSLVAIHLACRSLADGECDMALAGGARVIVPQDQGYIYEEGGIASPDGHCRAFDADARGLVPGNGIAVVLLKRLADALADGDPVLAVIKGSAINNDGAAKVGYNAPSIEGQARVIRAAHVAAGVVAASISYVEAHGTGTALGDPIEIAALKQAFAGAGGRGVCALGALKTNIGHLDAAAGAAGLIKAVLALHHRTIPPTLHFRRPNPELGLEESPFFVNTVLRAWQPAGSPRRAGVSAFGMGGTNAHVVLEEAPPAEPSGPSRRWQLLTVSARSRAALARAAEQLAEHLSAEPDGDVADVADVAWTLHVGRRAFPHRRAVVVGPEPAAAAAALRSAGGDAEAGGDAAVAFLFPGQGAQHPGMAWDLYRLEPVFRAEIDRAAELLQARLGLDLRTLLDPPAERYDEAAQRLERTELTQPALFAVEHALARLWMSWGVRPAAMLGHSVGEYVAACLAGVFSYEDALALVAERGRLMGELPAGAMLAVPLPEGEVGARLGAGLALAAVNGVTSAVVSGETSAVEALRERLRAEGIEARRLRVSHAFHSAAMDPIVDTFAAAVGRVERRPPALAWVSSVSGTWIEPGAARDPAYWARQLRQTVRFHDGAGTLLADPRCILLEVGPGETLSRLARRHPAARGRTVLACLASADAGSSGQRALLQALGRLWTAGIEPDWPGFHAGERRRRVPLPTYPFERQRYWAGGRDRAPGAVREAASERQDAAVPPPAPPVPPLAAEAGDEIERTIASIWSELFGLQQIGFHDGFLALGGDSLLATQIVARMRTALGRDISLGSFLEAETIAGQATICRTLPAMTPPADTASLLADLESRSADELEILLAQVFRGGGGEPTTQGPR